MSEKLQKVLAREGLGSRRGVEKWIEEGRVSVNGKVSKVGDRVEEDDVIRVDGRVIKHKSESETPRRVLLYNKPEGEVCSRNDPNGRPTVYDRLPPLNNMRWVSVGRLDINSEGLLLFSTDGELANRLMHPSSRIEREYAARVFGEVTDEKTKAMSEGVLLEDGMLKFDRIRQNNSEGSNTWFNVSVHEGKYREVRRLFESQDLQVNRLLRIRYGPIELPRGLKPGNWIELEKDQIDNLASIVQMRSKKYTGLYGKAKTRHDRQANKRVNQRGGHLRRRRF